MTYPPFRFWFITIVLILMSSSASAESLINSYVEVSEVRANLTIYRWTGSFEGSGGFTTCYVKVQLSDERKNIIHEEELSVGVYRREDQGVRHFDTHIVLQNKDAALLRSAFTRFTCY